MIIVLDGPNKAGKTTLINRIANKLSDEGLNVALRKWGPLSTDDREYGIPLIEDTENFTTYTIWDRAWPSEHVYSVILNRERRMRDTPFIGEFLHRRVLFGQGVGFILFPQTVQDAQSRFDITDAGYSDKPSLERSLFMKYATTFKWPGLVNKYTEESLEANANFVINTLKQRLTNVRRNQRHIIVPPVQRSILFVGRSTIDPPLPGGWIPFTSQRLFNFASLFGPSALVASWCDPEEINKSSVYGYQYVVGTDNTSENRIRMYVSSKQAMCFRVPVDGGKYTASTRDQAILDMAPQVAGIAHILRSSYDATKYL